MIGGAIDPQHAVDQDADPVGHALHVAEDVRAEEDRPAAALDDLDQRFEEIAADDRVEPERRIVEDQQLRVGGHGQRQGDLGLLAAREPADPPLRRKLEMIENLLQQRLVPAARRTRG